MMIVPRDCASCWGPTCCSREACMVHTFERRTNLLSLSSPTITCAIPLRSWHCEATCSWPWSLGASSWKAGANARSSLRFFLAWAGRSSTPTAFWISWRSSQLEEFSQCSESFDLCTSGLSSGHRRSSEVCHCCGHCLCRVKVNFHKYRSNSCYSSNMDYSSSGQIHLGWLCCGHETLTASYRFCRPARSPAASAPRLDACYLAKSSWSSWSWFDFSMLFSSSFLF